MQPGTVTYFRKGALSVGEAFTTNGTRLKNIAAVLNRAVPTSIIKDVHGAHWTKLIMNLNNAIPAITGLSVQEAGNHPGLGRLAIFLMREGLRVAKQAGITLGSLPGLPKMALKTVINMPLPMASRVYWLTSKSMGTAPVPGSTLQSIQRGKPTEIDYLNGEIVDRGRKLGIPTLYNISVVDMVHRVETTGKFLSVQEVQEAVDSYQGNRQ